MGATGNTALYTPPSPAPLGNPWDPGNWDLGPAFTFGGPNAATFAAADVDGDGQVEVVIFNNADLWTGVLKWQNGALVPLISPLQFIAPEAVNGSQDRQVRRG